MYNMETTIFGFKFRVEILILIIVLYFILFGHLFCSCCTFEPRPMEGFRGANTNGGLSSPYTLGAGVPSVNTSNWGSPDLTVTPGKPFSKGVNDILNREPQPVPLPEGQLSMFATTPFKPECCPTAYSNGSGCACMTTKQYNYLITRGGNNIPYSEY